MIDYLKQFIVYEGPDGSGKTTQFRRTLALLEQCNIPFIDVREPGGTGVGEKIRQVLLDHAHQDMALRTEMLLYMASRAQLIEQRIEPAIKQGKLVLADRFVHSTFAYQGHAGGLPLEEIMAAANIATQSRWPSKTIIYDVDEITAAKRISPLLEGSTTTGTREIAAPDRMEAKGREFHRKVRQGYLDLAKQDPEHIQIIDASRGPEEVWTDTARSLVKYLQESGVKIPNPAPLKQYIN